MFLNVHKCTCSSFSKHSHKGNSLSELQKEFQIDSKYLENAKTCYFFKTLNCVDSRLRDKGWLGSIFLIITELPLLSPVRSKRGKSRKVTSYLGSP